MDSPNFSRSPALNNIPNQKIQDYLDSINNSTDNEKIKGLRITAANRYAESNIPVEYWPLKMDRDFHGDPRLLEKYNRYVADLKSAYMNGTSLCLAGNHGLGKTFTTTSILKKACQKGYSCLYSTLSDIVTALTLSSSEDKYLSRKELVMVDFLVIDEFDNRFMPTDNAADLYARTLESVFRTRGQNKLPTLMCTNSPNVVESFNGPLKQSVNSLMKGYIKMFPVFGDDFRKKIGEGK
jgi:DNA replication protein DnaC